MILGFLRSFALTLASWVVELLGLVVVWFALLSLKNKHMDAASLQQFSQYPQWGHWVLLRLPRWALLWDNAYDGMLGDKRGWWANECKGAHTSRINMWRWAALRNPANYFSRNICGVDVSTLRIVQVAGTISDEGVAPYRGWLLLKGMAVGGKVYPRFYFEWALFGAHGLMFDIGWKVKLSHNGTAPDAPEKDRIKGIVFTLSPWKELS